MSLGDFFNRQNGPGSAGGPGFNISISMQALETTAANIAQILARIQQALSNLFANDGVVPKHYSSANTTNATSVNPAASTLRETSVLNTTATKYYLKFYDKASAPTVGTDIPVRTFEIAVTGTTVCSIPWGVTFNNGIAFALTSGFADTDTGAAVTGLIINLGYS